MLFQPSVDPFLTVHRGSLIEFCKVKVVRCIETNHSVAPRYAAKEKSGRHMRPDPQNHGVSHITIQIT